MNDKKYKQKTSPKSCKTQIKILVNPGLANWALNNPDPDLFFSMTALLFSPFKQSKAYGASS